MESGYICKVFDATMSHQDVEDEEAAEQQGIVYDHDWDPEADILDGEPGERESGDRREGDDDQRSCANCSRPILWSSACAFCPEDVVSEGAEFEHDEGGRGPAVSLDPGLAQEALSTSAWRLRLRLASAEASAVSLDPYPLL